MKQFGMLFVLLFICALFPSSCEKSNSEVFSDKKDTIKWVDFNITAQALKDASKADIESFNTENHIDWIKLLALIACDNGGNFSSYKSSHSQKYIERILSGEDPDIIGANLKYYDYYCRAYGAVLSGLLGSFYVEGSDEKSYGITGFSPIASGYSYSHYKDFGASRSYGYARNHLGHDLMGSIGTPIIAVESGYVEAVGWNQFGGWRIGIRSFDGKRYWYYAHLRKNHPYNDIYEGKIINAGEVIGYLGMTGYSAKENVNNINIPHLHIGLQLIFDPLEKDSPNQIWIDLYEISKFLSTHTSKVYKNADNGEYYSYSNLITEGTPE